MSVKGRAESSSCAEEEPNLIGEGLFGDRSSDHLSSEEENLANEAVNEIQNLLSINSKLGSGQSKVKSHLGSQTEEEHLDDSEQDNR